MIGDQLCGQKEIKIDINTFRQFKNIIISEAGFYSIQVDTIGKHCYDCSFERLEIKSNYGTKVLQGYQLNMISDNAELLFNTIYDLVGFIGRDE